MTDGRCAVHSSVATGTCARCGTFICVACPPASCQPCAKLLSPEARRVARAQRWAGQATFLTSFGTVTVVLSVALLGAGQRATPFPLALLLLGLACLLAAPALAVGALWARRGTKAPGIVGRAVLVIGMGGVALLFALVIALGVSGFD